MFSQATSIKKKTNKQKSSLADFFTRFSILWPDLVVLCAKFFSQLPHQPKYAYVLKAFIFHIIQLVKSLPFHKVDAGKKVPLSSGKKSIKQQQ